MKELERTKRISISAVLFLLVILIGFLTFKRPQHVFEKNTAITLEKIIKKDYIVTLNDLDTLDPETYTIIDIRSNFEYTKGHMKDALNITSHDIFNSSSIEILDNLKTNEESIIFYGKDPDNANTGWMLLYQLGYDNVKILCIETEYIDKTFRIKNSPLEKPYANYAQVMTSVKSRKSETTIKEKPKKKVVPVQKKKKRLPEGGC
jgi:rhodanese-related sulfurtransferase